MVDRAVAWVWLKQREFHRSLTNELNQLAENNGSAWWLVVLSFLYGVFHAAGPGHGKAVVTTYLLAHGHNVRRGVAMASASALLQGITALVLVYGLVLVAGWLPRETRSAVEWTERISFLLLSGVGLILLVHGLRSLSRWWRGSDTHEAETCHAEHAHHHEHEHCDHCTVSAEQLEGAKNWRAVLGVILAVGLRPCSGGVLVLIFAHVMKIHWAGVAAVMAMSVGTAITVSTLALLTVNARQWAVALTEKTSSRWWNASGGVIALAAGGLIFASGILLLVYSFGTKHQLGL